MINPKEIQQSILHLNQILEKLISNLDKHNYLKPNVSNSDIERIVQEISEAIIKGAKGMVIQSILEKILDKDYFEDENSPPSLIVKLINFMHNRQNNNSISILTEMRTLQATLEKSFKVYQKPIKNKNIHVTKAINEIKKDTQTFRNASSYRSPLFAVGILGLFLSGAVLYFSRKKVQIEGRLSFVKHEKEDDKNNELKDITTEECKKIKDEGGIDGKAVIVFCYYGDNKPKALIDSKAEQRAFNMNSKLEFCKDFQNMYSIQKPIIFFNPDSRTSMQFDKSEDILKAEPQKSTKMLNISEIKDDSHFTQLIDTVSPTKAIAIICHKTKCQPCTEFIDKVKVAYSEYYNENFEIIFYSLLCDQGAVLNDKARQLLNNSNPRFPTTVILYADEKPKIVEMDTHKTWKEQIRDRNIKCKIYRGEDALQWISNSIKKQKAKGKIESLKI